MKTDRHDRLFVAGGSRGHTCVLDARTGTEFTAFRFATGDTYVNDVVLTDDVMVEGLTANGIARTPDRHARLTTPPSADTTHNVVAVRHR